MTDGNGIGEVRYGRSPTDAAWQRRAWLHKRLTEMADDNELPTTVSSLYYDGAQAGQWPSDDEVKAKGGKRTPRQDVSDAVQWLIDHGLVGDDAVVDLSRGVVDYTEPDDLLADAYEYVMGRRLSPWLPHPAPLVVVESRSLLSALDGTVRDNDAWIAPLVGMGGRSLLRDIVNHPRLRSDTPIGYLGDWNPAGRDIERNAKKFLTTGGWRGTWKLLAVTRTDTAGRPTKTKHDNRHHPPLAYESVEAEALGTTALRQRLQGWFSALLPPGFDRDAHERRTSTQRDAVLARLRPPRQR